MGKRLEGNGLYESMRMIIPQHREAALKQDREEQRKVKPILDEQEIQQIERVIIDSFNRGTLITLTLFHPFDDVEIQGVVTVINTNLREIKLSTEIDEWEWIQIKDIIAAE